MLKFQLKSGKIAELNLASIDNALALYRAVIQECKGAGLDISGEDETTIGDLLKKNMEAILNILGSEQVMEAIKNCCDKVLYDKQKFSMDIFEDERARGDFFGLMLLVAVENLRPFFVELTMFFDLLLSGVLKA
jgi:hypothetical protein